MTTESLHTQNEDEVEIYLIEEEGSLSVYTHRPGEEVPEHLREAVAADRAA